MPLPRLSSRAMRERVINTNREISSQQHGARTFRVGEPVAVRDVAGWWEAAHIQDVLGGGKYRVRYVNKIYHGPDVTEIG